MLDGEYRIATEEELEQYSSQTENEVETKSACYQIRVCCGNNVGCFGQVIDWNNKLAYCHCDTIIASE